MTDWVWDTFDTTPSMSSYIVAMIVSNLNYFEAQSESFRNVTVRVSMPHLAK
jgi:aminopeptidase N